MDLPLDRPRPGQNAALSLGRGLCFLTILFASGDVWPTIRIGLTFRFAQLGIFLAAVFILSVRDQKIRAIPGAAWLYGFILWISLTLPWSLFLERSVAYVLWAITDVLIILLFVHYFNTEAKLRKLIRWHLIAFIALSWFGLLQFALGLAGIHLLVTQWWIQGVLPRINGLSYEPSYYATYLIPGWVFAYYMIETKAAEPSQSLLRICLLSTTVALVLCSSRMGWLMMILWIVFRWSARTLRLFVRGVSTRRTMRKVWMIALAGLLAGAAVVHYQSQVSGTLRGGEFLLQGLGILGESSHSSQPRLQALEGTWRAFLDRPIVGTGIGALPAAIAAQQDEGIFSLAGVRGHLGMSIFPELLATTGVVGTFLMIGFAFALIRRYKSARILASPSHSKLLSAIAWSIVWILMILQFNENYLRLYLFVDLAVLICCVTVISGPGAERAIEWGLATQIRKLLRPLQGSSAWRRQ